MIKSLSAFLAALLVGVVLLAASPPGDEVDVPVRPAGEFAESVGVVLHPDYLDTPYADRDRVLAALRSLGIRHVRAAVQSNPDPKLRQINNNHDAFLRRLAAAGIRSNLVVQLPGGRFGTVEQSLAVVRGRLRGAVETLEGANEPDLFAGAGWPERARAHQRSLYARAKADPALRRIPVIAPSIGLPRNASALGDVMDWADLGNAHPYPGAYEPGRLRVRGDLAAGGERARGKDLVVTETGYHDALADRSDHPPASERAAGAYVPRLLLEHFDAGVRRTYLYELIDEFEDPAGQDREKNFGLLRHDFSDKPAARGLRALLRLAREGGGSRPAAGAPPLRVELGGDLRRARRLALRRGDGSVLLLLWQGASLWDRDARVDVHPAPLAGRLALGSAGAGAELLRVAAGTRAGRLDSSGAGEVRLPADDLLAIVIRPR